MKGIGNVKYGELHFYSPFVIKGNQRLQLDKLLKSTIICDDYYMSYILDVFNTHSIKEEINGVLNEYTKEDTDLGIKITLPENHTDRDNKSILSMLTPKIILDYSKNVVVEINNDLSLEIQNEKELSKLEFDNSSREYGQNFVRSQERFFLTPVKVRFKNGNEKWIIPQLIIFANGIGSIKYDIPIINSELDFLMENQLGKFMLKFSVADINNIEVFNDLENLTQYYLDKICEEKIINDYRVNRTLYNLILIDYEGISKNIDLDDDKVVQDIYFLMNAPVPNRKKYESYIKARDYVQNQHHIVNESVTYIVKENGGLISLLHKDQLDEYMKSSEEYEINDLYKRLSKSLGQSVDFALLYNILLNSINYSYLVDKLELKDIKKTKLLYHRNKLFLSTLIQEAYGSVCKQTFNFKNKMSLYHTFDIFEEQLSSIDNIININENIRKERFDKFISVASFIVVFLLGLPSIIETFSILKLLLKWPNVPYISIAGVSAVIWLGLLVVCLRWMYVEMKKTLSPALTLILLIETLI